MHTADITEVYSPFDEGFDNSGTTKVFYNPAKDETKFKKWQKDADDILVDTIVAHNLFEISTETDEYKGKPIKKMIFKFCDNSCKYVGQLTMSANSLCAKDFINRLASLNKIEKIRFVRWKSQVENSDDFYIRGSIQVEKDGKWEKVDLSVSGKELNEMDKKSQNKALIKMWDDVQKALKYKSIQQVEADKVSKSESNKNTSKLKNQDVLDDLDENEFDDDVPF